MSFAGVFASLQEALVLAWTRAGGGHQQNVRNRVLKARDKWATPGTNCGPATSMDYPCRWWPKGTYQYSIWKVEQETTTVSYARLSHGRTNCMRPLDYMGCFKSSFCPDREGQRCTRVCNCIDTYRDNLPCIYKAMKDIAHMDKNAVELTRSRKVIDKYRRGSTSVPNIILKDSRQSRSIAHYMPLQPSDTSSWPNRRCCSWLDKPAWGISWTRGLLSAVPLVKIGVFPNFSNLKTGKNTRMYSLTIR